MAQHRRLGAWLVGLLVLAGVVGLAVQVWPLIWAMPERLHPPLAEAQLRGLTPDQRLQRQQEQRQLQNQVRTTLVQGLVGLLALTGAAIGASVAWRQLQENRRHQQRSEELTREGQITDRYTKAVEQLGNDKGQLGVTLGGIYALERIAKDSERDHPTVVEVLSASVREESRKQSAPQARQEIAQEAAKTDTPAPESEGAARPATDVQAALTVLGRLPHRPNTPRADLSEAHLPGAQLFGANLSGAQLHGADLSDTRLERANLSGAWLWRADLSGALLNGANLSAARLFEADLSGALLFETVLSDTRLDQADLSGARLRGVNLSGASLEGANLSGANLNEADLRTTGGLRQAQLDSAHGNARTQLPEGLQRPDSWATGEESAPVSS